MPEFKFVHDPTEKHGAARFRWTGRLIFGLVIITLGVLFTLDNLDLIQSGDILLWWPLALVAVGVAKTIGAGTVQKPVFGIILGLVGIWWLLSNLGYVEIEPWDVWPVFLIAAGIMIVIRSTRAHVPQEGSLEPDSRISAFAFMSGTERKISSQEFQGGDVTAIMGGHDLDLRQAKPAGGTCVIDLLVWWGGVDLLVPDDWKVTTDGLAIMGAIEDSTRAPSGEARGHLILRGLVVMGGVEVKNKK